MADPTVVELTSALENALTAGDVEAVDALMRMIASRDPDLAEILVAMIRRAIRTRRGPR